MTKIYKGAKTGGMTQNATEWTFQYIKNYIDGFPYPPTIREIVAASPYFYSTSVASHHIKKLIKQGRLGKFENKARTLHIIEPKETEDDNAD